MSGIKCKVLGIKSINFTNDEGQPVKGRQLWVCGPSDEPSWNGYEVMKIWHPAGDPHDGDLDLLIHDDTVTVDFNRRGKPFVSCYSG